jgi:outer membrane protein assembly factor BamA
MRLTFSAHTGWAVRFTSELSNIGTRGFLDFIKNECAGLFALPVGKNAAFHLEWSGGAIFPINKQHKSLLMDRFYLGGISPFGLRGFELRGVGPSDARRVAPQVIYPLNFLFNLVCEVIV